MTSFHNIGNCHNHRMKIKKNESDFNFNNIAIQVRFNR